MPYNNTPITPSKEVTGTVSLPLARVKKIISTDPDIASCSNNASFVITLATELFLQHLVQQSYHQVRAESAQKPRRNIQYRDVANAVARVENLEFLSDVVPRTTTMKAHKQKMAKEGGAEKGQAKLEGFGAGGGKGRRSSKAVAEAMDVDDSAAGATSEAAGESDDEEMEG